MNNGKEQDDEEEEERSGQEDEEEEEEVIHMYSDEDDNLEQSRSLLDLNYEWIKTFLNYFFIYFNCFIFKYFKYAQLKK